MFEEYIRVLLCLQPRPSDVNTFLELQTHTSVEGGRAAVTPEKLTVDDFELLKVLGKGSFGKVYMVRLLATGEIFAMKVLKKNEVAKRNQVEHTLTERRIMESVRHPYIVNLRYAFQSPQNLYMVSDYCMGGELFFHLKRMRAFSEDKVRIYSAEITLGLEHLHAHAIVYRDLKPENVLLDEEGHVRLTDFGLSRDNVSTPNGATTFCGTPEYLAPEMILHRRTRAGYGKPVDWWGLGTLMFEMLTGLPPFYDKNIRVMCDKILNGQLTFPEKFHISPEAQSVIKGLLNRRPEARLDAAGLKAHPFFAGLDWAALARREIPAPFRPRVASETDSRNFDESFTKQTPQLTPPAETPLNTLAADFGEFTYIPAGGLAGSD